MPPQSSTSKGCKKRMPPDHPPLLPTCEWVLEMFFCLLESASLYIFAIIAWQTPSTVTILQLLLLRCDTRLSIDKRFISSALKWHYGKFCGNAFCLKSCGLPLNVVCVCEYHWEGVAFPLFLTPFFSASFSVFRSTIIKLKLEMKSSDSVPLGLPSIECHKCLIRFTFQWFWCCPLDERPFCVEYETIANKTCLICCKSFQHRILISTRRVLRKWQNHLNCWKAQIQSAESVQ